MDPQSTDTAANQRLSSSATRLSTATISASNKHSEQWNLVSPPRNAGFEDVGPEIMPDAILGPQSLPVDAKHEASLRVRATMPGAVPMIGTPSVSKKPTGSERGGEEHKEEVPATAPAINHGGGVEGGEVMDEDQMFRERLYRRTNEANEAHMVQNLMSRHQHARDDMPASSAKTAGTMKSLEAVDSVQQDSSVKTNQRRVPTTKSIVTIAAIVIVFAVVIGAAVIIYVVVSNAHKHQSSSPLQTNAPNSSPTLTPATRLEYVRSVLLDHEVSSLQDMDRPNTAQYQALNWLVKEDQAKWSITSDSVETIIHRYVLAVFYFSTNGSSWTDQCQFLSANNICEWHDAFFAQGVLCSSSTNELQELVFNSNALGRKIPVEIRKLSSLTKLELAFGDLSGTIPTQLGQLVNLTTLKLRSNRLSGTIPTELGNIPRLNFLDLVTNNLAGSIPTELARLSSLS